MYYKSWERILNKYCVFRHFRRFASASIHFSHPYKEDTHHRDKFYEFIGANRQFICHMDTVKCSFMPFQSCAFTLLGHAENESKILDTYTSKAKDYVQVASTLFFPIMDFFEVDRVLNFRSTIGQFVDVSFAAKTNHLSAKRRCWLRSTCQWYETPNEKFVPTDWKIRAADCQPHQRPCFALDSWHDISGTVIAINVRLFYLI